MWGPFCHQLRSILSGRQFLFLTSLPSPHVSSSQTRATVQAELENHRKTTYKKEEIRITWLAIWID